jgi:CO dehydrogenase/acetyl-CoA synthase epsilon subunit
MGKKLGSKRVFSFCFLFSLCLHGGVLFFLQNYYSFRTTPHLHEKSFAAREKMVLPARREDSPILRLSFHAAATHDRSAESSSVPQASSLKKESEDFGTIRMPAFLEKKGEEAFVPLQFSSKHKEESSIAKNIRIPQKKQIQIPSSLVEKAKPKESTLPVEERVEKIAPSLQEAIVAKEEPKVVVSSSLATVSASSEIAPFHYNSSLFEPKKAEAQKPGKKGTLIRARPPLTFRMPSSSDLHILSCSNDFDVDVVYNLREDGEGYLFAISLIPKKTLSFQKIKQNYLFLLDRSHSIGEERFFSTKAALFSVLSLLGKEDTFNIIAFDKKSEALFEKNMPANAAMIRHAREFLQKQKVAGMFSTTNVSRPLFLGSEQLLKETGSKAIVYFSNGETLDKAGHKKAIYDWTQKNKGAIAFYSMIQKGDQKGPILEYLSQINKGKFYVAQTPSGCKRQLRKLISSIHTPVALNMESYVYLMKGGSEVMLYPSLKQLPNLYLDQPFVVMGTTKKLEPFTLFLQGKNNDQWFHIKKDISFQESRSSTPFLYEEWAHQRAYRCYDAYLQDGKESHLKEAKDILTPYRLEEAFR